MTKTKIDNLKYSVCCPICDNEKCLRGTDQCEAEQWAKEKLKEQPPQDQTKGKLVERQVIVNWYSPEEKTPPEDWDVVLCTVSGRSFGSIYDHVLALMSFDKRTGWEHLAQGDEHIDDFVVHAWCDLDPYKG